MHSRSTPTGRWLAMALLLFVAGCRTASESPSVAVSVKPETPIPAKPEPLPFKEISLRAGDQRTPVVMYHDVVAERTKDSEWYDVSKREFETQMNWIRDEGITPVSLEELRKHLVDGDPLPEKAIVLTFDDNYRGFKEIAWPILRSYGFPVAMFVHTGFVGDTKTGRPKMAWEDLKELVKDPLFTVGAHTVSHPEDMRKLSPEKQFDEMKTSKDELEEELGIQIPFLAYPNGMNDKKTQEQAKKAGFLMAFSIDNGPAEESPNILCVNRYVHTRLKKAWDDREKTVAGAPAGLFVQRIVDRPVEVEKVVLGRSKLILVKGGTPMSMSSATRVGVPDFVKRAEAVAGINGGFFVMSEIRGTDNTMLGPCKTSDLPILIPDTERSRWPKLRNRPLVVWGKDTLAILPYQPEHMNDEEALKSLVPDMTDTFLGGVWLVRNGIPRTKTEMNAFASKDIQDFRKRAFFGVMVDGSVVLGASRNSVSSERLAEAAASAGVAEAVLLDSGFSTSLVCDGKILASGHSTEERPSRPVPHAIVVKGSLAPEAKKILGTDQAVAQRPSTSRKRRRT